LMLSVDGSDVSGKFIRPFKFCGGHCSAPARERLKSAKVGLGEGREPHQKALEGHAFVLGVL